jgi:hypothetical protein
MSGIDKLLIMKDCAAVSEERQNGQEVTPPSNKASDAKLIKKTLRREGRHDSLPERLRALWPHLIVYCRAFETLHRCDRVSYNSTL